MGYKMYSVFIFWTRISAFFEETSALLMMSMDNAFVKRYPQLIADTSSSGIPAYWLTTAEHCKRMRHERNTRLNPQWLQLK
jgi:hypothetical protein